MEGYHMPVVRAPMFPPMAQGVIDDFLGSAAKDHLGEPIVGLRIDIYNADEHTDHHINDIALRLYAQRNTGSTSASLYETETESLDEPSLQAFKDLLYGLHLYGGQIPYSIGFENVIPWADPKLKDSFKNAYVSLHATRDFTLATKEYFPSWISGHKSELTGRTARIEDRRAFCSMVIPPVETAHEEIEQVARQSEMTDLARALYDHLVYRGHGPDYQLSLTEIDFSNIEDLTR
jgi:hypothetical protein